MTGRFNPRKVYLAERLPQSVNHYLTATKAFCNWMVREGRGLRSPIEHLRRQAVTDKRERRALSPDEMQALINAAQSGPDWRWGGGPGKGAHHPECITGPERAILYRLAVETGLRRDELASLKRASFELTGEDPAVTVANAYTKNRQAARLPLRPDTVALIAQQLKHKAPAAKAFNVPGETARMIRADLDRARQAWLRNAATPDQRQEREKSAYLADVDHAGRVVDFHSLRHTCGSWLAAAGVHPKVVQRIMWHGSITLTMDRYTHLFKGDEAEAIGKLPGMKSPDDQRQSATGTSGQSAADQLNAGRLTVRSAVRRFASHNAPKRPDDGASDQKITPIRSALSESQQGLKLSETERAGFEPAVAGEPPRRFSKPVPSATRPPLQLGWPRFGIAARRPCPRFRPMGLETLRAAVLFCLSRVAAKPSIKLGDATFQLDAPLGDICR